MSCSEANCELDAKTRGLCSKHYQKWKRKGIGKGPCSVSNCKHNAYTKGMCKSHYEYALKKKLEKDSTRPSCIIRECAKSSIVKKMCTTHHESFRMYIVKKRYFESLGQHKCEKCGNDDIRLLQFDHIHNDGTKMRKSGLRLSGGTYTNNMELFKKTFQVLCANCNVLKRYESGGDLENTLETWKQFESLIDQN